MAFGCMQERTVEGWSQDGAVHPTASGGSHSLKNSLARPPARLLSAATRLLPPPHLFWALQEPGKIRGEADGLEGLLAPHRGGQAGDVLAHVPHQALGAHLRQPGQTAKF